METPTLPPGFRERLEQFDKRLRVLWSHSKGLWEVQEWLRLSRTWSHVMYWCDRLGQRNLYRPLPASPEGAFLKAITRCDMTRYGGDATAWRNFVTQMENENERVRSCRKATLRAERRHKLKDVMPFVLDQRVTTGPGKPPSRPAKRAADGMAELSKFAEEQLNETD